MPTLVRIACIVVLLTGPFAAVARELSLVPASPEEARDIVETRLWLKKTGDKLFAYQFGRGATPSQAQVGEWPEKADLDAHLRIGQEALSAKPVDWKTFGMVINNFSIRTPRDRRVEALAQVAVKTPLPPETSGVHWFLLNQSFHILLRQDTEPARATVFSAAKPEFWQDTEAIDKEDSKGASDLRAATIASLREAAIIAIAEDEEPNVARAYLESLLKDEPAGMNMHKAITHYIDVAKTRAAGGAIRPPDQPRP